MTTSQTNTPAAPNRRLFKVVFVGAVLIGAWTAYASVHNRAASLHAVAQTEHQIAEGEHRLAQKLTVELAKEYLAIRPADTDAKPPPIPPSETWPSQ